MPSPARQGRPLFGWSSSRTVWYVLVLASMGSNSHLGIAAGTSGDRDDLEPGSPPLVLTPSRLPQRLDESPSTVTVIDRALIEASGARRLVDVLRLVPGFQVGYKINSLPTAAYHGLNDEYARRTLLLLNGQRIFQYARGVIEWNNLPVPLENIERIEVIRGPAAAAYGSNALQAVINIQTGGAAEYAGFSSRITSGDDGIADGFLRYGGRWGRLNYAFSLASVGDDGYPGIHDNRRNTNLSFLGDIPFAAGGELQLQAGFARGDYQIQDPNPALPTNPRDFPVTDHFQSLRWRWPGAANDEWVVTLSHNAFHYGDQGFTNDRLLPGIVLRFDYDIQETRYEADAQYLRRFSDRWRATAGLGYYHEAVHSPPLLRYRRDFGQRGVLVGGSHRVPNRSRLGGECRRHAGAFVAHAIVAVSAPDLGPPSSGRSANPADRLRDGLAPTHPVRKRRSGHRARDERAADDLWRHRQR
ncbi:TonB-dependent receptor [Candidatus Competibacter phosphatis]|uniref:TonB-dependent receptor n=1 Tax=Candidatus Competibacter phosphatis TaxID=221280 RepID=A0ABX1TNX0_9GAMM|nr:TonB-dependent receptor [Candidatus Competibacter phosphatis]